MYGINLDALILRSDEIVIPLIDNDDREMILNDYQIEKLNLGKKTR